MEGVAEKKIYPKELSKRVIRKELSEKSYPPVPKQEVTYNDMYSPSPELKLLYLTPVGLTTTGSCD